MVDFHSAVPDVWELTQLAQQAARGITPTELHGAACGIFAGGGTQGDLIELVGEDSLTDQESLTAFWHGCLSVAFSHDLEFAPVLDADDDVHVAQRVDALAQWSATFLAGYTRLKETADIVGETREIIKDLTAIAQADTDMDESDANEADFVDLFEFVRVAGMLLFADAIDMDDDADQNVH